MGDLSDELLKLRGLGYEVQETKPIDKSLATAPYNFVSLPKKIVPSQLDQEVEWEALKEDERINQYKDYILDKEKLSGYIQLKIETKTPCFIGGNGEEFFALTGKPVIPGSSLRGMTKNLFKIITCGAMRGEEDITDRHLYFRCMMAPNAMPQIKKLHEYYVSRMTLKNQDGDTVKKAKAGFLIRKKGSEDWYICPAEIKSVERKDFYRTVPKNSEVDWDDQQKGAYCLTGNQANKQYIRFIHQADWDTEWLVPKHVIQEYLADKNRRGLNLLSKSGPMKKDAQAYAFTGRKDINRVVPCFYIREGEEVTAFGHGRSFRIPYKNSVAANIPNKLQEKTIDFSDAVFGKKELWASRVFFEDAELLSTPAFLAKNYVKPLLGPNPTSYQFYLKQNKEKYPPKHWDEEGMKIRGYKLYWHNDIGAAEWQAQGKDANKNITQQIKPLAAGNKFQSRIRFKNLSSIELGALLQVFSLQEGKKDIVYKIGKGKSLGMGSIKIGAQLYLDDGMRYSRLFSSDGWLSGMKEEKADSYLQEFKKYMKDTLGKEKKEYDKMMNELKNMLDWNLTKDSSWKEKIKMMSGDVQSKNVDIRYVKRAILPTVTEVIE